MVIDTGPRSFATRNPFKNIICLNISRYLDNSQYINRNNVIFGNMPKWIWLWFSEYHHIPIDLPIGIQTKQKMEEVRVKN